MKNDEIKNARDKAMLLNTHDILVPSKKKVKPADTDKKLTFLIYHNEIMVKNTKRVVKECQSDIDRLIGKTRIVVAERRNGNIGSCVFAKSSFSTQETTLNWRKTKNVREEVVYNMWYNHVNWCTQCTGVRGYHTLTF